MNSIDAIQAADGTASGCAVAPERGHGAGSDADLGGSALVPAAGGAVGGLGEVHWAFQAAMEVGPESLEHDPMAAVCGCEVCAGLVKVERLQAELAVMCPWMVWPLHEVREVPGSGWAFRTLMRVGKMRVPGVCDGLPSREDAVAKMECEAARCVREGLV